MEVLRHGTARGWRACSRDLECETSDLPIPGCHYDTFIDLRPCVDPPGFVAIF